MLERERLELCGLDEPALLGSLDEGARPFGLEKLVQLLVRQVIVNSLSGFVPCLRSVSLLSLVVPAFNPFAL